MRGKKRAGYHLKISLKYRGIFFKDVDFDNCISKNERMIKHILLSFFIAFIKGINEYKGGKGLFKYTSFSDDGDRDVNKDFKLLTKQTKVILNRFSYL